MGSDAIRLSYPDWIVRTFTEECGAEATAALDRMNLAASVTTRDDGYVQDESSQWVAAAVGAREGEVVLDACAGPGGKTTAMATSGASIIGADRQLTRAGLVAKNAQRLSHRVPVVACDATVPAFADGVFDRVLVDAPCSGLGALRRRADARWRITESDVHDLARLQSAILTATSRLVRPGGVLVYSVCTITAIESIGHAIPDGFETVTRAGDERLPPLGDAWRDFGHGHRLLPHDADTDGMVIIRYRRMP